MFTFHHKTTRSAAAQYIRGHTDFGQRRSKRPNLLTVLANSNHLRMRDNQGSSA